MEADKKFLLQNIIFEKKKRLANQIILAKSQRVEKKILRYFSL